MKKSILKSMLLIVTSCVMFVSCVPPIMDWNPIRIYIKVSNAEGQNLLDSVTTNNFLDKEISAEWMGDTYIADTVSLWEKQHVTREYLPMMDGLMYVTRNGEPMLYFGELAGDGDYDDEPLTLYWPDGSTDIIRVKAWADEGYRDLKVYRRFTYNLLDVTKDTSNPIIKIIKE